jgi:circadian clock protein KaiC
MYILKSRGMAHSNQVREFLLTDRGIELVDVYVGPENVLLGSTRLAQESREKAAALLRQQEIEARQRERERKREALEARIAALRKEFEAEEGEAKLLSGESVVREDILRHDRERMAISRQAGDGARSAAPRARSRRIQGDRK